MAVKVSIVIPIYKVELFIARTIDSILNQNMYDIEAILVDDGSPDQSGKLADQYATIDSRVKVIHQKNMGVSSARNAGVMAATGEYIAFVDADDFIDANIYVEMYKSAIETDADLIICGFTIETSGREVIVVRDYPFPSDTIMEREMIRHFILEYFIKSDGCGACWNKLYRRNVLLENDLQFPVGLPLGEDYLFNMHVLTCVNKVLYLPYPLYHYIVFSDGANGCYRKDKFEIWEKLDSEKQQLMKTWGMEDEEHLIQSYKYFIAQVIDCIIQEFRLENPLGFSARCRRVAQITHNYKVKRITKQYRNKIKPAGIKCMLIFPWLRRGNLLGIIIGVLLIRCMKVIRG